MNRLTKERKEEIKKECLRYGYNDLAVKLTHELLDEIEALEERQKTLKEIYSQVFDDREKLKEHNATLRHEFKMAQASMPEVKQLRERVAKLREALNHYSDGYQYDKCTADETVAIKALAQDDEMVNS